LMPRGLVSEFQPFGGTYISIFTPVDWRWKRYVPPKHRYPPASTHSIATQKSTIGKHFSVLKLWLVSWNRVNLRKRSSCILHRIYFIVIETVVLLIRYFTSENSVCQPSSWGQSSMLELIFISIISGSTVNQVPYLTKLSLFISGSIWFKIRSVNVHFPTTFLYCKLLSLNTLSEDWVLYLTWESNV
jgi:hypothetical protein